MNDSSAFRTRVRGADGTWPEPPELWSHSSLAEVEACPRRWMLRRASYPDIWDRAGYPTRPMVGTLAGTVIHGALERLLRGLQDAACESIRDASAVTVLRDLGGFSALVEGQIDATLRPLESNPRAAPMLATLRRSLMNRVPALRQAVQTLVARVALIAGSNADPKGPHGGSGALGRGTHTEVPLVALELRFQGRADLLTLDDDGCVITDFKTGESDEGHADQVRSYALLWKSDSHRNPHGIPVSRLVIAYPGHDKTMDAPSPAELEQIEVSLTKRVASAEADLEQRPPPALPGEEVCRFCQVRQLCDEYWSAQPLVPQGNQPPGRPQPVDIEGVINGRRGPRSWTLIDEEERPVLLRTAEEDVPFSAGDRVRILNAFRIQGEEDDGEPLHSLTLSSETFVMREL